MVGEEEKEVYRRGGRLGMGESKSAFKMDCSLCIYLHDVTT